MIFDNNELQPHGFDSIDGHDELVERIKMYVMLLEMDGDMSPALSLFNKCMYTELDKLHMDVARAVSRDIDKRNAQAMANIWNGEV